jgi:propionyl-CoA carboxylase alpha chain
MPGLLVDVAVQPGQKVQAGETPGRDRGHEDGKRAVRRGRTAWSARCSAGKGESLAVDQIILEFN